MFNHKDKFGTASYAESPNQTLDLGRRQISAAYYECGHCNNQMLSQQYSNTHHGLDADLANEEIVGFSFGCVTDIGRELTGSGIVEYDAPADVRSFTSQASKVIIDSKVRKMNTFIQDFRNTACACGRTSPDQMYKEDIKTPVPANSVETIYYNQQKYVTPQMSQHQVNQPMSQFNYTQYIMPYFTTFKALCQKYRHQILTILVALIVIALILVIVKAYGVSKIANAISLDIETPTESFMDLPQAPAAAPLTSEVPATGPLSTAAPTSGSFMDMPAPKA